MPYGIKVINGRNVTVIDEDTPAASYLSGDWHFQQAFTGQNDYLVDARLYRIALPAIFLDPNIEAIRMTTNDDTQGVIMGYSQHFDIFSYSGIPNAYRCRRIVPFSNRGASADTHGMRIMDGSGQVMFDSGHNVATPTHTQVVRLGQRFTLPPNSWFMPISFYMYQDNNWQTDTGIKRVSQGSNVWEGNMARFGNIYPAANEIIGYAHFFENL